MIYNFSLIGFFFTYLKVMVLVLLIYESLNPPHYRKKGDRGDNKSRERCGDWKENEGEKWDRQENIKTKKR